MPRKKPVDPCKALESTARRVQQEAVEAESVAAGARLREQVLTDICRHMEVMTTLSSHYHSQQQKQTQSHKAATDQQQPQPQPQPARNPQHDHSTPQRADHQQQLGDSTTVLSDKGSRFDRPSLREQQAGHLLRSVPARLAEAMSLVPHFCCSTCLLQSASSDAISAAVQLSVQDWTQLYVAVIYELGILLDMVERQERTQRHQQQRQQQLLQAQQQQQQQQQQQPKSSVCDTERAGKKSSSDHQQQQQSCLTTEQLELPASSSGDLMASGGGTNSTPALTAAAATITAAGATPSDDSTQGFRCKGCGQPLPSQAVNPDPAAETPAAGEAAGGGADSSDLVTLLQVVEQLMGLVFLAGAVSPGQLLPAISLNHRTQTPQPAPESHWEVVVERLSLSRDQARYLGACGAEVLRLLRSQSAALHRLTALASGHSLLVMAAEGQPEQQQQQQEQVQQQQQEWLLLLRDLQRAEKKAGQALTTNAANNQPPQQQQQQRRQQQLDESILEGGADAATAVVDAMDTHVSQLPLFCFLLSYMLYDCLTPVQRAKCMVACYPWSLQPIPVALAAGELHAQLQHTPQEGPQQQTPEQQQQRKHQQQHRQQWWCERLGELSLTTEEASAVAAAAGLN